MKKGMSVVVTGTAVKELSVGEVFQYKSKSKPGEIHTYMVVDLSTVYSHFAVNRDYCAFRNTHTATINLESGQVRYFDNGTMVDLKENAYFEV